MKILLINPIIREDALPKNFPIGIGIIASIMLQNGFEVAVLDHNARRYDESTVVSELKKIKDVDVVGIGGLITVYGYLKRIVPIVRDVFPQAKIVIGGGVTIEPDIVFENIHGVDFCVHGEAEHTFLELCSYLREKKDDFKNINGISFIEEQKIYLTPHRSLELNLDVFPMPAYHIFPTEVYLRNPDYPDTRHPDAFKRQATLITSRGCPNKCTFCWRMTGRNIRFRSVEKVIEEIEYLKSNYDIDSMFLLDETINSSGKRLNDLCNGFLENKIDLPWISHARTDRISPEGLALMKKAGCIRLSVGVESGNKEMLEKMHKHVTPEQNRKMIMLTKQAGIKIHTSMMVGMPGETRQSVEDSVTLLNETRPDTYCFFITTPYPGSDLYYMPEVEKQILARYASKDKFFEALGDASNLTINLTDFSDAELLRMRDYAQFKSLPGTLRARARVLSMVKSVIPEKLASKLRESSIVQRIIK